jgi:hypothetical protein
MQQEPCPKAPEVFGSSTERPCGTTTCATRSVADTGSGSSSTSSTIGLQPAATISVASKEINAQQPGPAGLEPGPGPAGQQLGAGPAEQLPVVGNPIVKAAALPEIPLDGDILVLQGNRR